MRGDIGYLFIDNIAIFPFESPKEFLSVEYIMQVAFGTVRSLIVLATIPAPV